MVSYPLQIGVAVRHDGDPAFLSKVREKTMNKITTIGLEAPQQNLWVAEVGLRQMIRSVLSG